MTTQQMRWASQHDWYQGATRLQANSYRIHVYPDGISSKRSFYEFSELRLWAGY